MKGEVYSKPNLINYFCALLQLCKLNVVALLLLTAFVGMLLTTREVPDLYKVLFGLLGIGLSAASAAVFNHIVDEKRDAIMHRTKNRPLPTNRITLRDSLIWGVMLGIIGLSVLWFGINKLSAILTFLSLIGYAVVYTVYLKKATSQNIVIGGIAGATPPLLGWVAMTNEVSAFPLLLCLIIFTWTPPHFWALAISKYEDYSKIDYPMLPVTHGRKFTAEQILYYTILLFIVTLIPYLAGFSHLIYLTVAIVLNINYLRHAYLTLKHYEDELINMRSFVFSLYYLMFLFLAILLDHYFPIKTHAVLSAILYS